MPRPDVTTTPKDEDAPNQAGAPTPTQDEAEVNSVLVGGDGTPTPPPNGDRVVGRINPRANDVDDVETLEG